MQNEPTQWSFVYRLGGLAAIGAVVVGVAEILITFLPGGNAPQETVLEWFTLFQQSGFMGLRNQGLLNIFLNLFAIPVYLALFGAHRKSHAATAGLVMGISYIGLATFFATNRAFPMWDLSNQYALAGSEAEKAALLAAGQSMLAVGSSHSPGTFLGFALAETAGVLISLVMLQGKVFSKANAILGIVSFAFLLVYETLASFYAAATGPAMMVAMIGGLLGMAWYILTARRLFQLTKEE